MLISLTSLICTQYDEDGVGDRKTISGGRDTISGGRDTISGDRNTMRKSVRASKSIGALRDSRASGYGGSIYDAYADDDDKDGRRSQALSTLNGSRASRLRAVSPLTCAQAPRGPR